MIVRKAVNTMTNEVGLARIDSALLCLVSQLLIYIGLFPNIRRQLIHSLFRARFLLAFLKSTRAYLASTKMSIILYHRS